ncbi:hypothetical protein A3F52_02745 [Candidatus Uhrbacteria bacterium RIFCSPHIGHO2_12_FULL_47_11]|nr:MAG: hypothetical protein A3F52_02745 [Candidatus Uhrbacteria bacterium RIFCSPHIGHO2_12_FULL_47_11]
MQDEQAKIREEMRQHSFTSQTKLWNQARNAKTIKDWERLYSSGSTSDGVNLKKVIAAKLWERKFWHAEMLSSRARPLLEVDKDNPVALKYLREAKEIYTWMEKHIAESAEVDGDKTWNTRLNYLKGVYYFRSLFFVENPQKDAAKILDLISRSASHLEKVFDSSPKDWSASVAFEILQEKAKGMSSGGNNFQRQLQLLPQREVTIPFGLTPVPEGRH